MRRPLAIPLAFAVLAPLTASAQMEEIAPLDDDSPDVPAEDATPGQAPEAPAGPVILEEFTVDERNLVISAARTRTTIQEAPGIVTVITAEEIRQRGHRTVNDVLRTIPGFQGDRYEGNGWYNESFARGQPRTLLILVNGVNITEPLRNATSLDRKIPLDAVKRIEVTSGPGGVLWGSNALLGVVNIILKDHDDLDGAEFIAGGGHGPGAQQAIKGYGAYGGVFLEEDLKLFGSVSYYSDKGAELTLDEVKVLGALPAPEADSPGVFQPQEGTTDFNGRSWWLTTTGNVVAWDELTLDWMVSFEKMRRQIATGGSLLEGTVRDADGNLRTRAVQTEGDDSVRYGGIAWRKRFLDDSFGISAKAYFSSFAVQEDPFWAFPPRNDNALLSGVLGDGVVIALPIEQVFRYGGNFDADLELPADNHLIFGVEVFQERLRDSTRTDTLRGTVLIPELAETGSEDPFERDGIFHPGRCPPPGSYTAQARGGEAPVTFEQDCRFEEILIKDTDRTVGAVYVTNEWKVSRRLALQPGYRFQFSDSYDPVSLLSAAMVWNVYAKLFLKLNYAEGFRPPSFESTRINDFGVSGVSYNSDPDLKVERSRATEAEVNAVVAENVGVLDRIYLRGDYGYTILSDLIRNSGGTFSNAGEREIHSVEFLARADFTGGHELWFGGHFIRSEDSVVGPIRNFPNWKLTGGARVEAWKRYLELSTLLTWVSPQEDLNRTAASGAPFGNVGNQVGAADVEVTEVADYLLVRFGVRGKNIWDDRLELSAFVYNALNAEVRDPDFFFDDRVLSRPQPRPGWSAFGQATVRF